MRDPKWPQFGAWSEDAVEPREVCPRHQALHLTLRGRRQHLEAHAALPRHEDAVRHQRMGARGYLQSRAEKLAPARPLPFPAGQ
ncbi:MAG TPA: hypothetical protein VK364_12085 [Hymenobacter sp.]|nr:hypothetical protein [Hymenobacter sp.]